MPIQSISTSTFPPKTLVDTAIPSTSEVVLRKEPAPSPQKEISVRATEQLEAQNPRNNRASNTDAIKEIIVSRANEKRDTEEGGLVGVNIDIKL